MGLGLAAAQGLQGGWDTLHQIIADRQKQQLLAQAEADKQRSLDIDQQRANTDEGLRRAIFEANEKDKADVAAETAKRDAEVMRRNAAAESDKADDNTRAALGTLPIGTHVSLSDFMKGKKAGLESGFTADPIDPTHPENAQSWKWAGSATAQQAAASLKQSADEKELDRQARIDQAKLIASLRPTPAGKTKTVKTTDANGQPITYLIDDDGNVLQTYAGAPPPALQASASDLASLPARMERLKELSGRINTHSGLGQVASGLARQGAAATGNDDDVAEYTSLRDSLMATFSRLAGERGVLTEGDIDRAGKSLPKIIDPRTLALRKFDDLDKFYEEKIKHLPAPYLNPTMPGGAPPPPPPGAGAKPAAKGKGAPKSDALGVKDLFPDLQ